jgi:hypothetical protein
VADENVGTFGLFLDRLIIDLAISELPMSYLRYLTRHFQDSFNMFGMEVRLVVKKSDKNPFANRFNKKTFVGIGGWKGRQKRMTAQLKMTGMPAKKGRRRIRGKP